MVGPEEVSAVLHGTASAGSVLTNSHIHTAENTRREKRVNVCSNGSSIHKIKVTDIAALLVGVKRDTCSHRSFCLLNNTT